MFKLSILTSFETCRLGIIPILNVYTRYAFPLWYLRLLQSTSYFKFTLQCSLVFLFTCYKYFETTARLFILKGKENIVSAYNCYAEKCKTLTQNLTTQSPTINRKPFRLVSLL